MEPTDASKLVGSNGSYVYTINNKTNDNKYSFTIKPSGSGTGTRYITLTADGFQSETHVVTQIARKTVVVFSSDFNSNNDPFTMWQNDIASKQIENQRLRVRVTRKGAETHTAQLARDCGTNSFINGKEYYMKFTISGNNTGNAADNKIYAYLQDNNSNYRVAVNFGAIEVTNQERTVTVTGLCDGTGNYLVIHVGHFVGDIYIDNFELGYYE